MVSGYRDVEELQDGRRDVDDRGVVVETGRLVRKTPAVVW
jgi:hypothetical protein